MTRQTSAAAAATSSLALLLLLASSPAAPTAAAADDDASRKNRRRNDARHHRRAGGKRSEDDALTDRERDLWQNPLWATPNTDLFWSAKEQPHHGDSNWSAKKQGNQSNNNNNNGGNGRPKGNPWDNGGNSRPAPAPARNPPRNPRPPGNPRPQPQPRPRTKGNPWDDPTKYGTSLGSAPSPPSSSSGGGGAPRPSPPSSNQSQVGGRVGGSPTATSLVSSAVQGGGSPSAQQQQQQRTSPQQPQQQVASRQQPVVVRTSVTSTISLSGIPATLPAYGTRQWTTLLSTLENRIKSAISNSNQGDVSAKKITIISIGGVPVPTRRHRHLEGESSDSELGEGDVVANRSLQAATREVEYKAVLEYECEREGGGIGTTSLCTQSAQRVAETIADDLSAPTRGSSSSNFITNNYVDNQEEDWSTLNANNDEEGFVWLPVPQSNVIQVIQPPPTPPPVPQFEGDATKRYCGYGWDDVVRNCLTATPCPQGFASGVCPDGMSCIADTPCADPTWLAHLSDVVLCDSDNDCRPHNQFCIGSGERGSCADCDVLSNRGCRASEACTMYSTGEVACADRRSGLTMQQQKTKAVRQPEQQQAQATMYRNPRDNGYFCGTSYSAITDACLQSKPCPSQSSWADCGDVTLGCFYHPTCKIQYDNAGGGGGVTIITAFAFGDITEMEYQEEEDSGGAKAVAAPGVDEGKTNWRTTGLPSSAPPAKTLSCRVLSVIAGVVGFLW